MINKEALGKIGSFRYNKSMKKMIPSFQSLNEAIQYVLGENCMMLNRRRVSGGDINEAYCLELNTGQMLFLKENRKENLDFFSTEALGLQALKSTQTISIPEVYARGVDGNRSFLLMEWITSGYANTEYWKELGCQLAKLHQANTKDWTAKTFGFIEDNYIGSTRQINVSNDLWSTFFKECRLIPQIQMAFSRMSEEQRELLNRVADRSAEILVEPKQPSILHGDLWQGNVMCDEQGHPWLIDPATYVGHAEADLAMTECFGGFPPAFYQSYQQHFPLQPGYAQRKDFYNLYHMLNHLNLFGSSYLSSVLSIARKYAG